MCQSDRRTIHVQVIALAVLGFMLFILVEIVYFTQVPDALGTGTGSDSDSTGTGSGGGLLGGNGGGLLGGLGGGGSGGQGGGLFGGLLGGGDNDDNSRNYNYYQNNVGPSGYNYRHYRRRRAVDATPEMTPEELRSLVNSM